MENLEKAIIIAKDLMGNDFENKEYFRGICELLAEHFPEYGDDVADRAIQIAIAIGATQEQADEMYLI